MMEDRPADKLSCFAGVEELHVLLDDGAEQGLPNPDSNPLTGDGQCSDVDKGGECLQGRTLARE